jgi:hypothetical protein
LQVASAHGVVRHHLRYGPVGVAVASAADRDTALTGFEQLQSLQIHLQLDVECPLVAVGFGIQVRQRLRILGSTR